MRCLNLAAQWLALGGCAELLGDLRIEFVRRRANELGVAVRGSSSGGAVLLVDVYDEVRREHMAASHNWQIRVLVDDLGRGPFYSYDAVWNPNAYGEAAMYRAFTGTVLAGEDCVPLRDGLPSWDAAAQGGAVSFGGGAASALLADAIAQLPRLTGEARGWSAVDPVPCGWRRARADSPWTDLQHAKWLVTAAGSMLWEAAAVGIPVLTCVSFEHETLVAQWVRRHGAPVLDLREEEDPAALASALAAGVQRARALPRISAGARNVAARLWSLSQ
ncbi:MAG: hypothetical protein ABIT36_09810 [Steroidobacteraceae bacterium]